MSTSVPLVYLGMPRYGPIESGSARGFYCPSQQKKLHIAALNEACTSLTPSAFNDVFRIALDMRDEGAVTHFAMVHADVEPAGYWLDTLMEIMEAEKADLVSVVISMKQDVRDPMTSTAFGDVKDPWKVTRRIHLSDRLKYPETFGQEQAGPDEVLLVNTGLWVTDLRHPAWDAFSGFAIHTKIVKPEKGPRVAMQRSEDWEMSRHCYSCGMKVLATWAVPAGHRGSSVWMNR